MLRLKKKNRIIISLISLLIILSLSGCITEDKNMNMPPSKDIIVTFYPYKLMMNDLGINAQLLIPPHTDPHTYTPNIKSLLKIKNSHIIIADGYIDKKIISHIKTKKVFFLSTSPHGWLNISTFIKLSKIMKQQGYKVNESAIEDAKKILARYKGKIKLRVICLHKLLDKPLSIYGIKVVDELLNNEEDELSINDIKRINQDNADIILVTTKPQEQMLKGKVNKPIYVIDIMEIDKGEKSYIKTMRNNLNILYDAYINLTQKVKINT